MKFRSRGISRVIPVVILIVLVVIAAIVYYSLTSAPKASSTSTTNSTSSSLSSTPTSITSSTATTTTSSPPSTTATELSATTSSLSSTTSSATCVTASLSNATEGQDLVSWFGNYTSLAISFEGTKNGKTSDLNFSYTVAYKSPTTYKVNLNLVFNGNAHKYTLWALRNGTVLALFTTKNYTGSEASNIVLGYFSELETLDAIALQSTNAAYFHSTGTSTATIGTNPPFTVTNYVANTTPESIQGCGNSGYGTVSNYSVNLGTPSGSSFELVVSSNFAGSLTDSAGTTTFDFTYQVTAFTIA